MPVPRRSKLVCSVYAATFFLIVLPFALFIISMIAVVLDTIPFFADIPSSVHFAAAATLAALLAAYPTQRLYTKLRSDFIEIEITHCRKCNYNLTGNESGVCPECGMLIGCCESDSIRVGDPRG
jgi:hypothetical protein